MKTSKKTMFAVALIASVAAVGVVPAAQAAMSSSVVSSVATATVPSPSVYVGLPDLTTTKNVLTAKIEVTNAAGKALTLHPGTVVSSQHLVKGQIEISTVGKQYRTKWSSDTDKKLKAVASGTATVLKDTRKYSATGADLGPLTRGMTVSSVSNFQIMTSAGGRTMIAHGYHNGTKVVEAVYVPTADLAGQKTRVHESLRDSATYKDSAGVASPAGTFVRSGTIFRSTNAKTMPVKGSTATQSFVQVGNLWVPTNGLKDMGTHTVLLK